MSIGSRIKQRREQLNLSRMDLASKIGVTPSAVANYENEISFPKIELMYKLFDALDCDANYLHQDDMKKNPYKNTATPEEFDNIVKKYRGLDVYGRETIDIMMEREAKRGSKLRQQTESQSIDGESTANMRLINYYYRIASAGTGQIIFDMPPTKRIEIPDTPQYRKADYAIGVNGNSMEPLYHDGDTLLVEMTEEIDIGEIGIFRVDNESYVKKLGETELISLNPDAKNIPLNENAGCMGRVIGKFPEEPD